MSSNFMFKMIQKLRRYATNEGNKNQSICTSRILFYYSENIYASKVIKDICVNPCDTTVFQGHLSSGSLFPKKKQFFIFGLGECVYQISGLYLFSVGPKGAVQTDKQSHRHTYLKVKIGISSTVLSPHTDFENIYRLCHRDFKT